jgi:hypothetical protein
LACSLIPTPLSRGPFLREAFPSSLVAEAGRATGLPRSVDVAEWVGSRLDAGGATSAPEEFGAPGPGHMPFWPKRDSSLRLFWGDDACDASPGLTLATRSWFPTTLLLAVVVTARAWATLLAEEATLYRELDTPSSPKTHLPVGYRWQNSGCCQPVLRPQHSYIGDLVSHAG